MSSFDRRSLLDRAVGACLSLLVAAAAIFIAVRLIEAVAVALVVMLAVAALVAGGIAAWHLHHRGW